MLKHSKTDKIFLFLLVFQSLNFNSMEIRELKKNEVRGAPKEAFEKVPCRSMLLYVCYWRYNPNSVEISQAA